MSKNVIQAAGSVLYRFTESGELRLCIIHRPRYDDWSLPKGKLRAHESLAHAAVRETAEESGVQAILQSPLHSVSYVLGPDNSDAPLPEHLNVSDEIGSEQPAQQLAQSQAAQTQELMHKKVHYWMAYPLPDDQRHARTASFGELVHFTPEEIDNIRWISAHEAISQLTREDDKDIIRDFLLHIQSGESQASTLILARNAKAMPKSLWAKDPQQRPLTPLGAAQAQALTAELSCYAPERVYTSDNKACRETARPWQQASGVHTMIFAAPAPAAVALHRQSAKTTNAEVISDTDPDTLAMSENLAEVMEFLVSKPRSRAAVIATKSQLRHAAEILAELADNRAVAHRIKQELSAKKALDYAEAVAITIVPTRGALYENTSRLCSIRHVTKVKPIVF